MVYRDRVINAANTLYLLDLAEEIAEETGFTIKASREFLVCFFEKLQEHLVQGDIVLIKGIGRFYTYVRKSHQKYDFSTKTMRDLPPKAVPKFTFAETFINYFKEHYGEGADMIGDDESYEYQPEYED